MGSRPKVELENSLGILGSILRLGSGKKLKENHEDFFFPIPFCKTSHFSKQKTSNNTKIQLKKKNIVGKTLKSSRSFPHAPSGTLGFQASFSTQVEEMPRQESKPVSCIPLSDDPAKRESRQGSRCARQLQPPL